MSCVPLIRRFFLATVMFATAYAADRGRLVVSPDGRHLRQVDGTPFFYLRQPEDTIKGQMYDDLGFGRWTFEIERTGGKQIADRLREVWTDYPRATGRLKHGMDNVGLIYGRSLGSIGRLLDSPREGNR